MEGIVDIDGLREKIDNIDNEMLKLFCDRMRASAVFAGYCVKNGLAVVDQQREREKLDYALNKTDPELRGYIADLFFRIFELDRSYLGSVIGDTEHWVVEPSHFISDITDELTARSSEPVNVIHGPDLINIALIGMPGCGKTSIGRYLAGLIGYEFYDTNELISEKAGKSVDRIYADDGEGVFRELETLTLNELTNKRGCVIAAGGDVVMRAENKALLRRNSTVVFLDRTPAELLHDGMARTDLFALKSLYLERLPLYIDWSDYEVATRGGVERTALAVRELLQRKA